MSTLLTPKSPTLFDIPYFTPAVKCKFCPRVVYFVHSQPLTVEKVCVSRTSGREYPTPECCPPNAGAKTNGKGFNHFSDCPGADKARRRP